MIRYNYLSTIFTKLPLKNKIYFNVSKPKINLIKKIVITGLIVPTIFIKLRFPFAKSNIVFKISLRLVNLWTPILIRELVRKLACSGFLWRRFQNFSYSKAEFYRILGTIYYIILILYAQSCRSLKNKTNYEFSCYLYVLLHLIFHRGVL